MADGVTFARERLTEALWAEMRPLAEAHQAETGVVRTVKLDLGAYLSGQQSGAMRLYVARAGNVLIGYCSTILHICSFDQGLEAHEDAIYLEPAWRGTTGSAFERWIDDSLTAEGVRRTFRERLIHPGEEERATRRGPLGYRPQSVLWRRELGVADG